MSPTSSHPPRGYYAGAEPGGIDGTYDVSPGMSPAALRALAALLASVLIIGLVAFLIITRA